ncbi:MAG: PKD domain-containing protein [Lysobacteraceae bacterium]
MIIGRKLSKTCLPDRRLIAALLLVAPMLSLAADSYPMALQGSSQGGERFATTFAAFVPDRPVRDSEHGYSPVALNAAGQAITSKYQTPLTMTWDFGDGSSVVTGDQVTASHQYADDGEYTVTVIASDEVGEFSRATHTVKITNSDPTSLRIAATTVDPASQIVELSGWAEDVAGDPIRLRWDFGDGDSVEGDFEAVWKVRHQYLLPGKYEVTLTATDDDYPSTSGTAERHDGKAEKRLKITVGGGGSVAGHDQLDPGDEDVALTNQLTGSSDGVVNSRFTAGVRPFAGLYLGRVKSGACRFMFTVWDDSQLMLGMAVMDLFGIPPEGGRFRVEKPQFALTFERDAEHYETRRGRAGPFGDAGVGGLVQRTMDGILTPDGSELTDEQRDDVAVRLRDLTGIGSQPRTDHRSGPLPATSPLVSEDVTFSTSAGAVELDFVPGERVVGHFDVTMKGGHGAFKDQTIQVKATLAMDLEAAASDGLVNYDGCEPPDFEIENTWPSDGHQHLASRHPPVSVRFSDDVDPATLDAQSVQIAYTDTSGALAPVPVRILRDHDKVYAIPNQPLLPGVRYAVRVRAGDDGVRSRKGSPLAANDGEEWVVTSRFTTRVDMVPLTDGSRLLACHVYQPARDVPTIVGKPAVARVFANWEAQPGVHPDHQVTEFPGTVELYDGGNNVVARQAFRFVRPDLWEERGISLKAAENSANLAFTPKAGMDHALFYGIRVPGSPRFDPDLQYTGKCPHRLWDRQPTLSIDFVALPIDEWRNDPSILQALMPTLQRVADASVEYAMEQFPFANIQATPVRRLPLAAALPPKQPEHTSPPFSCTSTCILEGYGERLNSFLADYGEPQFHGISDWLSSQSSADVIVAFGPHLRLQGGATSAKLRDGRGVVMILGSDDAGFFPRYVNGTVHELGHVLELEHLPYVKDDAERAKVVPLRDGSTPFWYEGIEAMRISGDEQTSWNKSSTDGNEQGDRLFPLMFPGSIPTDDAIIANHHYRQIQKLLEALGR